jgi:hypothetical protein
MNNKGAGSRFLRLNISFFQTAIWRCGYPKIPHPNAAVQTMEKTTTIIIHMSSFFI